jgi:hypothetical protein
VKQSVLFECRNEMKPYTNKSYIKDIKYVYEEQHFVIVNLHLKAAAPIVHKGEEEHKQLNLKLCK